MRYVISGFAMIGAWFLFAPVIAWAYTSGLDIPSIEIGANVALAIPVVSIGAIAFSALR